MGKIKYIIRWLILGEIKCAFNITEIVGKTQETQNNVK